MWSVCDCYHNCSPSPWEQHILIGQFFMSVKQTNSLWSVFHIPTWCRGKDFFAVIWLVRFQIMTVIWLLHRLYRQTKGKECGEECGEERCVTRRKLLFSRFTKQVTVTTVTRLVRRQLGAHDFDSFILVWRCSRTINFFSLITYVI